MAFRRQQTRHRPDYPHRGNVTRLFFFPFRPIASSFLPSFPFYQLALFLFGQRHYPSRHHAATIRPLYHLILSTILLRSLPFRIRFLCIRCKTSTRSGSLNSSLLTLSLPPSFFIHYLQIRTTHQYVRRVVYIPALPLVMEGICFEYPVSTSFRDPRLCFF
jgi:hypothetical protein